MAKPHIIIIIMIIIIIILIIVIIFINNVISFNTLCVSCIKAFGCCCSLVHNELGNIPRDVFPN